MAKKSKDKQPGKTTAPAPRRSAPLRKGEVVTIVWTLAVLTALVTQFIGSIIALTAALMQNRTLELLFHILIVSSAIAGILSLVLLPWLYRRREDRPPMPLAIVSLFIAALPVVVIIILLLRETPLSGPALIWWNLL